MRISAKVRTNASRGSKEEVQYRVSAIESILLQRTDISSVPRRHRLHHTVESLLSQRSATAQPTENRYRLLNASIAFKLDVAYRNGVVWR